MIAGGNSNSIFENEKMNTPFDSADVSSRYIVGIDLGTTNSALAYVDLTGDDSESRQIRFLDIPQLTAPGELNRRSILPSFLYIPGPYELPSESTNLPWDPKRDYAVGEFAREQGALVPGRLVTSAKSWLCHGGVDRTAAILPWAVGADVRKVSPVDAGARYLQHLREAWDEVIARGRDGYRLEEQLIILTVPASFDEVARELTVTAARDAGLPRVILVEEPLAAFYAWLSRHEADWETSMHEGQVILVCDVGGGTTDFTIIAVEKATKGCASIVSPWVSI
jgi:molecular chaperone DnaK (HSP70)